MTDEDNKHIILRDRSIGIWSQLLIERKIRENTEPGMSILIRQQPLWPMAGAEALADLQVSFLWCLLP